MENRDTPPFSGSPEPQVLEVPPTEVAINFATPIIITPLSPKLSPPPPTVVIPENITQDDVEADPKLKRLQQDLLLLTSLNDNSSLYWRPSWFQQDDFNKKIWTLHNPPNIVTEKLPSTGPRSKDYYTRRIRRDDDAPSIYIKNWDHWDEYCRLYGVPLDYLAVDQINLMHMGLPRDDKGALCAPPKGHPLYPEPQPLGCGSYILDPSTYSTYLPPKFRSVNHDAASPEEVEVVVVHSDGALEIVRKDELSKRSIQWMHLDDKGKNGDDAVQAADNAPPKPQGPGRRWSYVLWTSEQYDSCQPPSLVAKQEVDHKRKSLIAGGDANTVEDRTTGGDGTTGVPLETEVQKPKRSRKKNPDRLLKELQ